MNGFLNDLRFGIRQLATKPGFAAAAILTLALGIGANTAVFSVLNGYLLRPLPYPHSDQLVQVNEDQAKAGVRYASISVPNYLSMVHEASDFSALAAIQGASLNFTSSGAAQAIPAVKSTASLFDVLAIPPLLGRTFDKQNQQPGNGKVVVLGYQFWQRNLGGDPDVVGKTLELNGKLYTILGVMPKRFIFINRSIQMFVPLVWTAKDKSEAHRRQNNLKVYGRIKPGISIAKAGRQMEAVLHQVTRTSTAMRRSVKNDDITWWLAPWHSELVGDQRPLLLLLQAAVLLVLLITCVNVANLLLSRILGRTHEMAMRSALGASRATLARQLLVEGLCLAIPGGAIGVGLAWWALQFIGQLGLGGEAGLISIMPDWHVALFALAAVLVSVLAISLLPIRHFSRNDVQSVLQEGSRMAGGGRAARRTSSALVMVELALATALLAGSGLLIHSFIDLQSVNLGFNPDNVLTARITVPPGDHRGTTALANFYQQLADRAESLPGVTSAGLAMQTPLHCGSTGSYRIAGRNIKPQPFACWNFVSGDYFQALGLPMLSGRQFRLQDSANSKPVVIVDRLLAQKYFPGGNAVGHYIVLGKDYKIRIIGVVPTIKIRLDEPVTRETFYLPVSQGTWSRNLGLVVRTAVPPQNLIRPLTKLVGRIDPLVSISDFKTMHQVMAGRLQDRHATMLLVIAFGAIALALAIVGVYGVMSYAVSQRRAECGVRLALGALPEDLSRLILKEGLRLLAVGLVLGLGLAVLCGFLISSQLFGVVPFDPLTLIGSAIVLCFITLAACYLPARRAAKLDPAIAMMEQ